MRGYFVEVSEEVKSKAEKCLKEMNCELSMIVRSSNHEDDGNFYLVLGYKDNGSAYPYCLWSFNANGNGSLLGGHYDIGFDSAMETIANKINYCTGDRFSK